MEHVGSACLPPELVFSSHSAFASLPDCGLAVRFPQAGSAVAVKKWPVVSECEVSPRGGG